MHLDIQLQKQAQADTKKTHGNKDTRNRKE